jgi:hypothetical protein
MIGSSANKGCETICGSEYEVTKVQKTFKRKARNKDVVNSG